MTALKCVCACSMVKPAWNGTGRGAESSSEAISIIGSSSETFGELAHRPASVRLAHRLYQRFARVANSCFYSVERLSHNALELVVMAKVVHRGGCEARRGVVRFVSGMASFNKWMPARPSGGVCQCARRSWFLHRCVCLMTVDEWRAAHLNAVNIRPV